MKIRKRVLVPTALVLFLILAAAVVGAYYSEYRHSKDKLTRTLVSVRTTFDEELDHDAETMKGLIGFIENDKRLQESWIAGDREELLRRAKPIFEKIRRDHRVTYFYFHQADRVNFLRVHNPPRHGDTIDRFTMKDAADSGKSSYGIELGPFGTFTLRVVSPWYIDGQLIGYLELGEEIEHMTPRLHDLLGVELFIVINKRYIDQEKWEEGLTMLGRKGYWDELLDQVIIDRTRPDIPMLLQEHIGQPHQENASRLTEISDDNQTFCAGFLPLIDAGGQEVGDIIAMVDFTASQSRLRAYMLGLGGGALLLGVILSTFLWLLLGRIERKLSDDAERHRALFVSSRDAIMTLEPPSWKFTSGNPAIIEMFGAKDEAEFVSLGPWDLAPELQPDGQPSRQKAKEMIGIAMKEGAHFFEWQHKRLAGPDFPTTVLLTRVEIGGQQFLQATVRDISAQKETEDRLRESENRFVEVLQRSSDAILLIDDGTFVDCNEATVRMLGYANKEELLNTHPSELSPALQPDGKHSSEKANEMIRIAHEKGSHQFEWIHCKADGTDIFIEVSLTPILYQGKNVLHCLWRDLTKQKRLEHEEARLLHDMRERIKEQACIYQVTNSIIQKETLKEIFVDVAKQIPAGWHYPEITRGMVLFGEKEYTNDPFEKTPWKQVSDILVDGEPCGRVEVYYLEERDELDEGPFLHEERDLIDGIAEALSGAIARKQAESTLESKAKKLHTITNTALDAVIMIDPSGRIAHWNPAAEEMFGQAAEEVMGEEVHHILAPSQYRQAAMEGHSQFISSGQGAAIGKTLELSALRKDGEEFPIEIALNSIEQDDGWWAVAVIRDITERKQAEEELLRSRQNLTDILAAIPMGFVVIGRDKRIRRVNHAALELMGYDCEQEILGKTCHETLCPAEYNNCPIIDLGQTVNRSERVLLTKDKKKVPILKTVEQMHLDGEDVLLEVFVDISDRKKAEETLKQFNEQLESTATLVKGLMTDVVQTNNLTGRFENPNLTHCWEVKNCERADCPAYQNQDNLRCWELAGTHCGGCLQETFEQKLDNCSHCEVFQCARDNPVIDLGETFNTMMAILSDRKEQLKETNQQLALAVERANQMAEQAKAATRAKSEFLANMSHEIRTPMTAIIGFTDLLINESLSAADSKSHLATVRRNARHLLQLINDILDISKIEAGKMVMELRPCSLTSTIADVASMMRPRAEHRKNKLEVRYKCRVPETIYTDSARLRQVMVNLVGNAVKFSENGTIGIGVSFLPQWRSDQSAVSVEVTDTGIGIDKEALGSLFQPFTQAESSTTRKYGGTGLGLAISRKIVTLLGGELMVRSTPGEGSSFTVTIPTGDLTGVKMLEAPEEIMCEDEPRAEWTPDPSILRSVKILLAEDGIDNQELIRTVLGNVGAEVEVVENGKLAVERAEGYTFDVVLMDMNMPEMDGYEATRVLRDRGYQRPILALTANAMSGDRERCLEAGCDMHLSKPIDRKQLIETVAQYANSKNSLAEAPMTSPVRPVTAEQSGGISSELVDDPVIADILPGFVERLPGQLEALCKALEENKLEDVERIAHRLKGSGGSYGYPVLSDVAKSLELAIKAQDEDGVAEAMVGVKEVCVAIQTGWTNNTRENDQP